MSKNTYERRLVQAREDALRPGKSPPSGDTPQARLLRAAQAGQFEAVVAEASPAQPPSMVTPEEREAALRADGGWPADRPSPAEEEENKAKKKRNRKKKAPELTPSEAYIAEHCRWVPLAERDRARRPRHREGRVLTEYDPITGELIGDGYIHDEDEGEEW